jgi:hypothetical protein
MRRCRPAIASIEYDDGRRKGGRLLLRETRQGRCARFRSFRRLRLIHAIVRPPMRPRSAEPTQPRDVQIVSEVKVPKMFSDYSPMFGLRTIHARS